MKVTKRFKFDAAHHLPNHSGKCSRIHGHTWHLDVTVEGLTVVDTGMVVDFDDLKAWVQPLIDVLDHDDLNKVVGEPTCENLLYYIQAYLMGNFTQISKKYPEVRLKSLRLREGDGGWAEL